MVQHLFDLQSLQVASSSAVAAWESVSWARGATYASWASFVVSFATLCIAFYAMNTWRAQEKVSAKREIKKAAGKLYVELGLMPNVFTMRNVNNGLVVSKSSNFEVLVRNQKEIDEWIMHEKLSELYLQLKYLGYAVVDDLSRAQVQSLRNLDAHYQDYYAYKTNKVDFEKALNDLLEILEVYK